MHLLNGVDRMKILFIHNIIAPYRIPLFEALAKEFVIHVVFLERKDENRNWNQKPEDLNFNHTFLDNRNHILFEKKITHNKGLRKVFNNFLPDLLVTLDNPPNFLTVIYSIFLAKKMEIPIILWTGAFGSYKTFQKNKFKNKFILTAINKVRNYMYQFVDFFWAYSKETKSYLINKYHIDEKKIAIGLQGYPDKLIFFQEVNTKERYNNCKLLFIGYLDERKGLNILLKVFIKLFDKYPNYTLEIIGIGKLYAKHTKEYDKIKNIKFLGYLDGIEKFNSINKSKYLILPSHSDPWGWVVNEVSSCKVPALVSDSVMAKEILDDKQLMFKTNSEDDLFLKLENLILLSYEEYRELSNKVYQNSRLHTMDKSINSFKSILKTLK